MDNFFHRTKAPHPTQNGLLDKDREPVHPEPPAKRLKKEVSDSDGDSDTSVSDPNSLIPRQHSPGFKIQDANDTAASINDELPFHSESEIPAGQPTAIENALPEIGSDKEAIDEYETFRASQGESANGAAARFVNREWVKGKSSLYVDAFNLALSTVLEDESHLFDAKEHALFECWDSLSYEAQYL